MIDIIKKYRSEEYDLSCSESMIYAFNEKYNLNLTDEAFRMMAPFSGGMYEGEACGILTGALSVLGVLYTNNVSHDSELLHEIVIEFKTKFKEQFGSKECDVLKEYKRTEESGCTDFIVEGALLLDKVIQKHGFKK